MIKFYFVDDMVDNGIVHLRPTDEAGIFYCESVEELPLMSRRVCARCTDKLNVQSAKREFPPDTDIPDDIAAEMVSVAGALENLADVLGKRSGTIVNVPMPILELVGRWIAESGGLGNAGSDG